MYLFLLLFLFLFYSTLPSPFFSYPFLSSISFSPSPLLTPSLVYFFPTRSYSGSFVLFIPSCKYLFKWGERESLITWLLNDKSENTLTFDMVCSVNECSILLYLWEIYIYTYKHTICTNKFEILASLIVNVKWSEVRSREWEEKKKNYLHFHEFQSCPSTTTNPKFFEKISLGFDAREVVKRKHILCPLKSISSTPVSRRCETN